jgi:hypothetical protein
VVCPRRIVRVLLVLSVTLVTWAAARPCWAAAAPYAPLCDDRGASASAPPPTFEATDEAVRRARASCETGEHSLFASIVSGRSATPRPGHAAEPVLPVRVSWHVEWLSEPIADTPARRAEAPGVRSKLERPPDSLGLA